jgi:hypothetical protein
MTRFFNSAIVGKVARGYTFITGEEAGLFIYEL